MGPSPSYPRHLLCSAGRPTAYSHNFTVELSMNFFSHSPAIPRFTPPLVLCTEQEGAMMPSQKPQSNPHDICTYVHVCAVCNVHVRTIETRKTGKALRWSTYWSRLLACTWATTFLFPFLNCCLTPSTNESLSSISCPAR